MAVNRIAAAILLIGLGLAGCLADAPPVESEASLESIHEQALVALERGENGRAAGLIDQGLAAAQKSGQVEWIWKFRLASSERLIRVRENEAALRALEGDPPVRAAGASLRGGIALNRARAYMQLGRDLEAEVSLDEAEHSAAGDDFGLAAEILGLRGFLAAAKGRPEEARSLLVEAYKKAVQSARPGLQVKAAGNLGYFLEKTVAKPDQAIPYYQMALDAAVRSGDKSSIVRARTNLGWCYNKLGDFDRALEMMKSAVPLAVEAGSTDLDNTLAGIGGVYQNLRDWDNAIEYYNRALEAASDAEARASFLNNLATCHIEKGEWDLAESMNRQAIANRNPKDLEALGYSDVTSAQILMGRGRLEEAKAILTDLAARSIHFEDPVPGLESYLNLGRISIEKGDPDEAERMFRLALGRIKELRLELKQREWKISFFSLWSHFAKAYVDLLMTRGQTVRALETAEANRALVLSERLRVAAPGKQDLASFQRAARRLDATLLSYWLGPKKSYVWAVTGKEIRSHVLPPALDIEALVEAHRNRLMASRGAEPGDPYAVRLYEVLVAPVAGSLTPESRVIVVPDGKLHELNFETLQTPGAGSRFWIEDVTLAVAPSLPLLQTEPDDATPPKSLLLVGDPIEADHDFPPLAGAQNEIQAILGNFPLGETRAIIGKQATPQAFQASSPGDYGLIHFTAHAVANTVNPLNSAVILSPQEGIYRLFARDIEETRLHAAVVTLSACKGAGAKTYSGEGLVGFAWAFLHAGAQNVVAGLWDVDDAASAELMDAFYKRLADGKDPATALRLAKLALLEQGGAYRKPRFWAPFQIYTRASPFGVPQVILSLHR